ncbi:MAG: hypothetical protein CVU84_00405 [Firmicutes bacterium HGW-Firmicutes-1]|jgi:multimeric flavodoxin WrbA|nr:MAG: hypothetical protein CVU84_00405 [Firmicutes bacterium HGW-Firmicutes-1]
MKILVINGARKAGNTVEVVRYFEQMFKKESEKDGKLTFDFEHLYLSDHHIDFCIGCHQCIFYGEDKCPHALKVKEIEEKILLADAIVLASPGYMFSVTGIMKNFLDHVAYNCHRPKYFGKRAFLISSCTKWQTKGVFIPMETWASAAGFNVVDKVYVDILPFPMSKVELDKRRTKLEKAAHSFYKAMIRPSTLKPKFGEIFVFHVFRVICKIAPQILQADLRYYEEKDAFNKDTKWYVPAQVSSFKHHMANFLEKKMRNTISKMVDYEKLLTVEKGFRNKL